MRAWKIAAFIGWFVAFGLFAAYRYRIDGPSADYFTALATFALVFVTGALWLSTHALWKSSHVTQTVAARAWVFAAPKDFKVQTIGGVGKLQFSINTHNYGNSPAILTELCAIVGDREPVGTEPTYPPERIIKLDFPLGPREGGPPLGPPMHQTEHGMPWVWGYVKYRDAFQIERTSRFCGVIVQSNSYQPAGPSAWNSFD